jgi:MoxR-like ATPase
LQWFYARKDITLEILGLRTLEQLSTINLRNRILAEVEKVVVGRELEVNLLLTCLLARGHVLLEGVPGMAKTLLGKAFSKCLNLKFKRVQFTPDMLPLDIIGGYIFNMKNRELEFKEGPVFTHILLADEINRAGPKVQSALLESMQEHQVTVEGNTTRLPSPFMVIATENPLDFEGVYPLVEGELDRFMMKINFSYPEPKVEANILRRNMSELDVDTLNPVLTKEELEEIFHLVDRVQISDEILAYLVDIAENTRNDSRIGLGASPRAMVQLAHCARANAFLDGRSYVVPEDIKFVAPHVLSHRIRIERTAELKGMVGTSSSVISELLGVVKPPR